MYHLRSIHSEEFNLLFFTLREKTSQQKEWMAPSTLFFSHSTKVGMTEEKQDMVQYVHSQIYQKELNESVLKTQLMHHFPGME